MKTFPETIPIQRYIAIGIHTTTYHFDDETIAYKILIWSQRMDEKALRGLTRQQFIKYGLLRLGVGQDLTRIERKGAPRRIAPANEVFSIRPNLKPPG